MKHNRQTESTAYNTGFALWGQTCFVETFEQGSTFVLRMNSSAKNPPQRKAPKRKLQCYLTHPNYAKSIKTGFY
jgi:hypothetical protein